MGLNSSCQEEWCVKPSEMHCECIKKSYCSSCFTKHMSKATDIPHKAYSVNLKSDSLTFHKLKYLKSDHSTEVYEGSLKSKEVIIKIQYFTTKKDLNRKQEEAALQRSIKHSNICRCIKSYIDETYASGFKFVMIMEKAPKDLDEEITERIVTANFWTEEELHNHFSTMIGVMSFMQQNNLAHRDIKPANILVFENGTLKLADFGLSIEEQDIGTPISLGVVGTLMYLSPKLMKAYDDIQKGKNSTGLVDHNPYKSDAYSLGLTFLYMASLTEPMGLNYNIEGSTYLHHKIIRIIDRLHYSDEIKSLLRVMLETEEELRMDFITLHNSMIKTAPEEPMLESFEESELPVYSSSDITCVSISLPEILNDPCLPPAIKSALSGVSASKKLTISHNLLPNEAEYIKIAMQGSNLTLLDLSECSLGYKGLKVIMQADLESIEILSLGNNNLGKRGAKVLMNNMEKLSNVKILRLWSNRFGDNGIKYLFQDIPQRIEELYLSDNNINEDGAKCISRNIPKALKILSLPDNNIGDKGARLISIALSKISGILHLYLDNNNIGPIGVKYLTSYLPNTLKSLRIIGNQIPPNLASTLSSYKYKISI